MVLILKYNTLTKDTLTSKDKDLSALPENLALSDIKRDRIAQYK